MFIAQFKPMAMKEPGQEEKEPEQTQQAGRSSDSEQFLTTPEAKAFVSDWVAKLRENNIKVITKRGITDLLGTLHRNSSLSDKQVIKEVDRILLGLTGLDGFTRTINKLKAATEGVLKGLKAALGG
ncbi:MAG: hypothetical protein AB1324_06320 [Candidatus Micrarchaeota archaeon]